MQHFSHSGDIGDIIYSLPTIRACGGGELTLFHFPGRTAHPMTEAKVARLRPLMEAQEYISAVHWSPSGPDHSLNGFRDHWRHGNLADMHLATHGLSWEHRQEAWLKVENPIETYPVIITRTTRYINMNFPWKSVVEKYRGKIAFIGFPEEHGIFCDSFGDVPFVRASDMLEVARIIAGSKLYIGNYTSTTAIAEGLKHPTVLEVYPPQHHLAIFNRINCVQGWDSKVELPCV